MKRVVRWLTVVHRWLGVVFCLVFLSWFASGLVMVFHRMPEYSSSERLQHLPPLDAGAVRISPVDAARSADLADSPTRVVLTTMAGRPVYRFLVEGEWVSVYADNAQVADPVTPSESVTVAKRSFGTRAARATYLDTIAEPDQWTFELSFRRTGPLHRVALNDDRGTVTYVSQNTGDIALVTDRASRAWAWVGAIPHWFYFRPLRARGAVWSNLIVYGSLLGCLVALAGIVIGVYRFSASRRFRAGTSASPYVGWLRWHHYAGLMFGVFVLAWTFSGMLSMSPWDWSPGNSPDRAQVEAIGGRAIDLARFSQSVSAVLREQDRVHAREVDFRQFLGAPYYLLSAATSSRLVRADTGQVCDGFTREELLRGARVAMRGMEPVDVAWLTDYDAYYYARGSERRLPVLRVRYADPDRTWLYLDAHDGTLVQREVRRSRVERWLYHGLHSLDIPALYQATWAWYPLIVLLCAGGLVLSAISVVLAWRVLFK